MTPGVDVRFRVSPLSAGTVRISPRASKTARAPVGEMCALASRRETLTYFDRSSEMSPEIVTLTGVSRLLARSKS